MRDEAGGVPTLRSRVRTGVSGPWVAYAVTAAVAAWATRVYWWPGRYVVSFDGYAYAGPNLAVSEAALRGGHLALWNDAIFGGVTHIGNPQTGTLYPPRLLAILLLENNRALGVLVAVHVVVLGTGMVALARRLGISSLAAAFAGCVSVLSGAVLTKTIQFEQILVIAWAPWLLVAIRETLAGQPRWPPVAATAGVTAAILLAGHPQMVFETIVLAMFATAGFAVGDGRWRRLPRVAVGVALGALIALAQLVAAAVATNQSIVRRGRSEASLLDPQLALVPGASARALLGTIGDRNPAAFVGSFESVAFIGVVVGMLAVVGLVDAVGRRDHRPWAVALSAAAALALLWSFGPRTIVFRGASVVLPGFELARVSARWLVLVVLIAALFAAAGLDAAGRGIERRELIAAGSAVLVGAAVIALRSLHGGETSVASEWLVLAIIAVIALIATASGARARLAGTMALGLVAVIELGAMSLHSLPQLLATDTPFTDPSLPQPTTEWLAGRAGYVVSFTDDVREAAYGVPGLRPNANVLVGIRSIDGYDGGVQITDRWAAALQRLNPDPAVDFPLRNNVPVPIDPTPLARLGVRYVLLDRTRPISDMVPGWVGPRAVDDWFEVWENPEWIGEAVAWSSAEVVDPDTAAVLLRERADELAATALVAEPAEPLTCSAASAACSPVGLDVERPSAEHMVVRTALDRPTVVTVDQQYESGWRVEVDDVPADVLEVDGLVLGVEVPAGRHEITWRYRPTWLAPSLLVGAAATIATIVVALGGPLASVARHRSGSSTVTDSPP